MVVTAEGSIAVSSFPSSSFTHKSIPCSNFHEYSQLILHKCTCKNRLNLTTATSVSLYKGPKPRFIHLTDELILVDAKPKKLHDEMLDLQHAAAFLPLPKIQASLDHSITSGSDLYIITVSVQQNPDETKLNLLERSLTLFRNIVPPLIKCSP
ncbi:L-lactate dehydrogenase B-like [Olea europaea var. sylvestris]|uniref:L-lactate dehydrogenase B-like n=1 Tax=Olea europaea var. sylvestris TaxID=158386 RepID=UPI000C1D04D7|nr:L-lactate dehydrogenase B-like [Olea europaea var. sylvestris]